MKPSLKLLFLLTLISALALVTAIGCESDGDDDDDDSGDGDDDDESCTAEQLCEFGVACGGFPDVETCLEESESEMEGCADIGTFAGCVCDCLHNNAPDNDCIGYGACATKCFDDNC